MVTCMRSRCWSGSRVVIATENDSVYLLDASDGAVVWKTHLGEPISGSSLPCGNVDPVGVTSTPVVDASTNRIYVVGMVQPGRDMLFELDLSSGHVVDSVQVDADGADPLVHNQRAALVALERKAVHPLRRALRRLWRLPRPRGLGVRLAVRPGIG